jgi:CPA1 family monovalent cation:H+ antiporter
MLLFEWTLLLLLVAVVLSAAARRAEIPYPTLLALAGAALGLVPGAPHIALEPDLALALFLAPVLLDASFDTSLRDLGQNRYPVVALVVAAVTVTTAAVAAVAHALVPAMPWAAAIALGAIVAPPDAAAATSILRRVGLPHRILVILEGESLLNDASALLIYRAAVGAALGGAFGAWQVPALLGSVLGGVVLGIVLARVFSRISRALTDAPSSIVVQFVSTFGVWILAERLGLSAVLTVFTYGVAIAHSAPQRFPARLRVPSYAVWETAVWVLNVLAFVLIGLQVPHLWSRFAPGDQARYAGFAAAILATAILSRFAWVMSSSTAARLLLRWIPRRAFGALPSPTFRAGLIVSWCGMRGIVTIAAALALPDGRDGTPAFPYRDLIVLSAFAVVVGTLVIQGLSLGPLLRAFALPDDRSVEREVELARVATLRAAVEVLDGDTSPAAARIREEYAEALQTDAGQAPGRGLGGDPLRLRAVAAARSALADLLARGVIGDDAYHRIEEDLDWRELSAGGRA